MNHPMNDEQLEQMLRRLGEASGPDVAFIKRMDQRLRRHHAMMSEFAVGDTVDEVVSDTYVGAGRGGFWHFIRGRVYTTITALFFVVATGAVSTFAYTSDSVTNGTALYPIKRSIERVQQVFVSNPEQQATYHLQMLQRRLAESRVLTLKGVTDDTTNTEVTLTMDHGIAAIRVLPSVDRRDALFQRVSELIDEQEREVFATVGATVPVTASTPVSAPVHTGVPDVSVSVSPATPVVTPLRVVPVVPSLSVPLVTPIPPVSPVLPVTPVSPVRVQPVSPEPPAVSVSVSRERTRERREHNEESAQPLSVPSPSTMVTVPQIPSNVSAPVRQAVERQHKQLQNAKIRLLRIEQNGIEER